MHELYLLAMVLCNVVSLRKMKMSKFGNLKKNAKNLQKKICKIWVWLEGACSQAEFLVPSGSPGWWSGCSRRQTGFGAHPDKPGNQRLQNAPVPPARPLRFPLCFCWAWAGKNWPPGERFNNHQLPLTAAEEIFFYTWSCRKIWFFSSMTELIFFYYYYYDLGQIEANVFGFLSEIENRNRTVFLW